MTIPAIQAQTSKQKITSLLVNMGLKVEKALDQAIASLLSRTHVAPGLLESELAVQEMGAEVDQAVFAALQNGDLLSSDVRHATAVVNISKELARLARLAANLGRRVTEVGEHCDEEDFSRLQPLAIAVSHLCRQTLRALTHTDVLLARNAAGGTATVDAYRDYVYRGLHGVASLSSEEHMHLLFASRCLEQIADHASELAENLVVFLNSSPWQPARTHEAGQRLAC
jgi:phosphate uptake regulator